MTPPPNFPTTPAWPADPEELLRHLPFVRGLARELLADEAAADDVAQEALLAALRRPQLRDGWRPWLVGTTRNLALLFRRSEARRGARERTAALAEALPSSGDESARLESLRRVVAALERLEPDDRALLLRRWYDGWPPRRIAAELSIPVDTARTRLQRALEKLRRELALRDSRERMRVLAPLLLSRVPAAPAAKLLLAGAAALLLAIGVPWALRRDAQEPVDRVAPPRVARGSDRAAAADLPLDGVVRVAAPADRDAAEPPGTPPPARVALRGRLIADGALLERWSTPLLVVGAIQQVEEGSIVVPPVPDRCRFEVAVARDGTFAADLALDALSPPLRRLSLRGADPRFASFERRLVLPDAPEPGVAIDWSLEIPLFTAATLRGHVVDAAGEPLRGMAVAVFARSDESSWSSIAEGVTGEDGAFALSVARADRCLVLATQPRVGAEWGYLDRRAPPRPELQPALAEIDVAKGAERDVGDLVMRPGASIRGRVALYARGPAAGAVVRASSPGEAPLLIGRTTRAVDPATGAFAAISCFADEEGDFELAGLAPGPWDVAISELAEACLAPDVRELLQQRVEAPADGVELLVELALVEFRCTSRGEPVEGVRVRVSARSSTSVAWRRGRFGTDETGATAMALPPTLEAQWRAEAHGFEEIGGELTTPAAGARQVVPVELVERKRRPAFRLRVRGPRGETIARNSLRLTPAIEEAAAGGGASEDDAFAQASRFGGEFLADAEGWCVAHDVAPGRYRLVVRPGGGFEGGDGCFAAVEQTIELAAGALPEFELDAAPAARLRVQARAVDGTLLRARMRLFDAEGRDVATTPLYLQETERGAIVGWTRYDGDLSPEGPCAIDPPLPPGRYEARFTCDGFAERRVPLLLEEGRCAELDVVLQPAQ